MFPKNPNITIEIVLAHPELPWDWFSLSSNPNMTIEIVLANPELPWNWISLSSNPNMTIDFVLAHPELPWNQYYLLTNKFLKDPIALKNYNKKMKEKRSIYRILDIDNRLYFDIISLIINYT